MHSQINCRNAFWKNNAASDARKCNRVMRTTADTTITLHGRMRDTKIKYLFSQTILLHACHCKALKSHHECAFVKSGNVSSDHHRFNKNIRTVPCFWNCGFLVSFFVICKFAFITENIPIDFIIFCTIKHRTKTWISTIPYIRKDNAPNTHDCPRSYSAEVTVPRITRNWSPFKPRSLLLSLLRLLLLFLLLLLLLLLLLSPPLLVLVLLLLLLLLLLSPSLLVLLLGVL